MPDFTYQQSDLFVLLMPETPQATQVWNQEIAPKTQGTGKILAPQFPEVKAQLQKAGYSVHKAPKTNNTTTTNPSSRPPSHAKTANKPASGSG